MQEAEKFVAEQEAKYRSRRTNVRAATAKPCTFVGPIGLDGVRDGQAGAPSTEYSPRNVTGAPSMLSEVVYIPTPRDQLASTSLEAKAEQEKAETSSESIVAGAVAETVQPDALPSSSNSQKVFVDIRIDTDTDTDTDSDADTKLNYIKYTCLPPRENFAKGVSEYIPYENLPGATGTYEKLRAIFKKARAGRQEKSKKDAQAEDGQQRACD